MFSLCLITRNYYFFFYTEEVSPLPCHAALPCFYGSLKQTNQTLTLVPLRWDGQGCSAGYDLHLHHLIGHSPTHYTFKKKTKQQYINIRYLNMSTKSITILSHLGLDLLACFFKLQNFCLSLLAV